MRSARKLRAVPDCPQSETPIKPVMYGAAPWSRLPPSPPAHEISIRVRAQSLLSRNGTRAELPDYETALRIIAAANRPKRVTVPEPLRESSRAAPAPVGATPPIVAAQGKDDSGIPSHTRAAGAAKESA